ncbi:MAG TPA: agmatinase [Caldilineaceae bacterium]|nr:agmatinase [Caldilineaceae bacterium]
MSLSAHVETPDNFLGLPPSAADPKQAGVLVLPIPFEATVSYGQGTAGGPAAIIAASQQVELYDREFDAEPALAYGIHTLPALALPDDPAAAVEAIAQATASAAATGKLVVGLGGEHTISVGFGRGLLAALGGPITVVQIDAHADLRDEYEGSPYSHACIARRLLEQSEVEQILQLGIRSVCTEEVALARSRPDQVRIWYAEEVHAGGWRRELMGRLAGRRVYLTIDVDGLDPALVPATGTPEPDGLAWGEALDILRTVCETAHIVGLDCVELAPYPGQHAADFAVAKLLYKTISYAMHFGR